MQHPDIRLAGSEDLERLVTLWVELGRAGTAADPRYQVGAEGARVARRIIGEQWLGSTTCTVVVADDALDGVVGFMTARPAPPHVVLEQPPTLVITDAYVAATHRRHGVGRRLFEAVTAAAGLGRVVEVGTLALDARAIAFWRSLGFGDWRVTLRRDEPGGEHRS